MRCCTTPCTVPGPTPGRDGGGQVSGWTLCSQRVCEKVHASMPAEAGLDRAAQAHCEAKKDTPKGALASSITAESCMPCITI